MTSPISIAQTSRKDDIFISYSRRDKPFVERLVIAFRAAGRDPWIDWEDIYEGEAWRKAIARGIAAADTFVYIISPDAVNSLECNNELEQAIRLNKRIIPIVYRDATNVHRIIAELNWIFFRDSENFDGALQKLLKAIDTDLAHVQAHTRWLSRAIEWEHGRDDGFLLRGKDLTAAEQWVVAASRKAPLPTELQGKYITKSREVEAANHRLAQAGRRAKQILSLSMITSGLSLAGAAIAITFATYHANQRVGQLNQQTQELAANIATQKTVIASLMTKEEQLTVDRTRLISELKKFGFTDNKIETLLVSSPEQWQYQIDQVKQANAGYQETVDRLKQIAAPPSTQNPARKLRPTPTPTSSPAGGAATPPAAPPSGQTAPPEPQPPAAQIVQRQQPVTVAYLARDLNAAAIDRVFKKLGFMAEVRPAQEATVASNVIYYSPEVSADDVKIVAFTLIRAGLQIKAIQPLPPTAAKTAKIELAAVPDLQDQPPLAVETIRNSPLPLPR